MLKAIMPRLLDVYSHLLTFHQLPMRMICPFEQRTDVETTLSLILECERLIRCGEKLEMCKLEMMMKDFNTIIKRIVKFQSFECDCKVVTKYVKLNFKSCSGFGNKLPELEETFRMFSSYIQQTLDSLYKSHKDPINNNLKHNVKLKINDLTQLFNIKKREYANFQDRFIDLTEYLVRKIKAADGSSIYVEEAKRYLNGDNDTFLSFMKLEDVVFMESTFGSISSSKQVQDLLRTSLKDVMKKRHFSLDNLEKTEKTDEQEKLLMDLKALYDDLEEVSTSVDYMKTMFVPSGLTYLQQPQFNMNRFKKQLGQILGSSIAETYEEV